MDRLYIYAGLLFLHYMFYVIFMKILSEKYDFKKIMINTYLILFILLLIFSPKEIIFKFDVNYLYIVLFALSLLFGGYIWYEASKMHMNLGKMDALAMALYLPALAFISSYFYKQKIRVINYIGIVIVGVGTYFALQE